MKKEAPKRIVEIQGVKLEVDMRDAIKIEHYKLHDNVKVLINKGYGDTKDWKMYPGVIAGFVQFQNKPIIIIAYLDIHYDEAKLEFINLASDTKEVEIAPALPEELPIKEADVIGVLDAAIEKKKAELREAQAKKYYFQNNFNKYFEGRGRDSTEDEM